MASLSFMNNLDIIKGLFHNSSIYSLDTLFVYMAVSFVLAVVTYGVAVPSGLFIPCMLMGACMGRILGETLHLWFPLMPFKAGGFALLGAAAMLASVTRLTVTITVIL